VNLGAVCEIAEGILDNAAHLISASSEQRGRVVRNDPGVTKTEIKIKQNYRIMTPKILGKTFVTLTTALKKETDITTLTEM